MENFKEDQVYREFFTVTKEVYEAFQKCSGDFNPLHTDNNFAKEMGFSQKVMYGNILNAFLSCFIGEKLPIKNVIIHSQEITYKNPVFLNDNLILEALVLGVYDSVNTVEFKYKFFKTEGVLVAKGKIQIGILK